MSFRRKLNSPRRIANSLFSTLSIFVVCSLIGIMGYWLGQPSFVYSIAQANPKVIRIDTSGGQYHPNLFITGAGRGIYKQWIETEDGVVVHKYLDVLLSSDGESIRIHQQSMSIPPLKPGIYYIKAEVFIQPNPIRSNRVNILIGKLEVR